MANKKDYIPAKDSELVAWGDNFIQQLRDNASLWEIPPHEVDDLRDSLENFKTYHSQADSPAKNKIIVTEKNTARKDFKTKTRNMVSFRLQNPLITDAQRVAMGLHVRDTSRTRIPAPTSRPEIDIDVLDVRRLLVRFQDMGSTSKARPYGVNGAVISFAVLNSPPASPADLIRTILATHTPFTLEFTEEERGKTVYIAICWQNERGEKGPYSEIESAIIP
jgi:hypothetical protein